MKNFIFDLDGTLIDSYPAILKRIMCLFNELHIEMKQDEIYQYIIKNSVGDLKHFIADHYHIDYEMVDQIYKKYSDDISLISPMKHVYEVLQQSQNRGNRHFIFTNRGLSTFEILDALNLRSYFMDIVIIANGIKYKPNPEGINDLINRNHLIREECYYIGDRKLDVQCANNAHIQSVFFNSSGIDVENLDISYRINDLMELLKI